MPKQSTKKLANSPEKRPQKGANHTPKTASTPRKNRNKKNNHKFTALKAAFIVLAILIILGFYCFDITPVSTNAMLPALNKGDVVLSWAPRWLGADFKPGDVILLDESTNASAPNFLRLIAENGTVSFKEDELLIDGDRPQRLQLTNTAIVRPPDEPEIWRETLANGAAYKIMLPQNAMTSALKGEVSLDKGVFLAGDNRYASYDSRQHGAVERNQIRGKALLVLESTKNDGFLGSFIKWIE